MRADTHSNTRSDRRLDTNNPVEQKALEDALQQAIDLGVMEWEDENEEKFFASHHVQPN